MYFAVLILIQLLVSVAFGLNGANDAPVIPPGPATTPAFVPPPPPAPAAGAPSGAQLPIDTLPTVNSNPNPAPESENPAAKIMPLLQGLGGGGVGSGAGGSGGRSGGVGSSGDGRGGDRAAGGDDASYAPTTGSSSAVQYSGGGETLRGGQTVIGIAGCSTDPGKFQFIYGHAGACSASRDAKLKMSDTLALFLDRNLNRCVAEAVGISNVNGGKFYHAGALGDARHQQTGSLHNAGLAIDLNAISVNNQMYSYKNKDARTRGFFDKFRECWGKAANRERLGCLNANRRPPGTIGDENTDHRSHLHLSVPLCPADAKARGLYLAVSTFVHALVPTAAAREREAPRIERRAVDVPNGLVELTIRDQHGEPVDADHRFSVSLKCRGAAARPILVNQGGCEFVSFTAAGGEVELRYLTSVMRDGELVCRPLVIKKVRTTCASGR